MSEVALEPDKEALKELQEAHSKLEKRATAVDKNTVR